ncbi:MAG: hypothetical protein U0T84_04755 [Chitinophagales bacterium]
MRHWFLSMMLLAVCVQASAQGKQQYRVFNEKGIEVQDQRCVKGLSSIILDQYRLVQVRRNIFIEFPESAELFRVELFSANELRQKFGKPVSPLNKDILREKQDPVFHYFLPQGVLKPAGSRINNP